MHCYTLPVSISFSLREYKIYIDTGIDNEQPHAIVVKFSENIITY